MPNSFTIPDQAINAVGALTSVSVRALRRLRDTISASKLTLDVPYLAERIATWTGEGSQDTWESILGYVIIPLNQIRSDNRLSAEELISDVGEGLLAKGVHAEDWYRRSDDFAWLFAPDSYFSVLSKALSLSLKRSATMLDAKIFTELRPVYDEDGAHIEAELLSNTLVIEMSEPESARTIHVTLDMDDLRTLSSELERARHKNATLLETAREHNRQLLYVGKVVE